ncbi:MORN repeat-containing protein 1 isoform X2 [Hyla sarda]|uniref:MORN repeat-containing protein 1 isoform X2 n=1 Tax=Hyla sarda TaxID=327740 RepID=UPI0024C3A480|nr:MORN repeat-containing protein 1 isoform X2 [Hyla sarda]
MAAPMKVARSCQHYVGDVKKQLRHGYGVYVYENSFFRYDGEWKDGKKHGHGKLLFRDGSYYEGEFVHGEITGNGLRYWAALGNTYSGEFQDGELHGHGVMKYKDGGRYEGHGLLVDKEGQTYSGAFHNNKKHGDGQMTFQNGDHYEGNWVLDQRQGHGVLHCVDGTIYEDSAASRGDPTGDSKENLLYLYHFPKQGQWRNDVFSGQGTMIHCSGVIYDGPWINGRPADVAKKITILGEDVKEVVQGSPATFHVQLMKEDGIIAENENGRVLRISAGIKHIPSAKSQATSILELIEDFEEKPIQTPFGYECINYPLSYKTEEKQPQDITDPSLLNHTEVESSDHELLHQPGGHPSDRQDEYPKISISDEDASLPPPNKRVEMGRVSFEGVVFVPPPSRFLHYFEYNDKTPKKTSGKLTGEKTEKMTVSQEKIEDSRSDIQNKERKGKRENLMVDNSNIARTGEYVVMVEDITSPPFLGHALPTAFKLVRIVPEKSKGKIDRKSAMLHAPTAN